MIGTSLLITLAVFAFRSAGLLEGLETKWLHLMARVDRPEFNAPVTLVDITNEDFLDPALFDGLAPLNPAALDSVLRRIFAHRPTGVIVDIQIHPGRHESPSRAAARLHLYQLLEETAARGSPPVVLVRALSAEQVEQPYVDSMRAAWETLTRSPGIHWANPDIESFDGYVSEVPLVGDDARGPEEPRQSVLGAAIEAFHLMPQRPRSWWCKDDPCQEWRIRFTGHFIGDTAMVSPNRISMRALLSAPLVAGQKTVLTDRVAILGGSYLAGRDQQSTPVGTMSGVALWAEALGSWIRHDALREPPALVCIVLEFLLGVVTAHILERRGPAVGLLLSWLIVFPLTIVFSVMTFGSRVLFINFLPACVGVYLHYQVEVHVELRHLKEELRWVKAVFVP